MKRAVTMAAGIGLTCLAWNLIFAQPPTSAPRDIGVNDGVSYPQGPWWQADISDVVLAPAHILIRHAGAAIADGDLNVPVAGPERTRRQAAELALKIASELQRDPARWDSLVQAHSDDVTTRHVGGRLGVMLAVSLPPPLVDALGALRVGETSHVVSTALGFHVVRRLAVPPLDGLSGSEIVISHVEAQAATRRDRRVERSLQEARELSESVARKVAANPEEFASLAREHSDAPHAVQGGDFGERAGFDTWSPVVLETLRTMPVGTVSQPIEDPVWGFRILQRTSPPRETLAATVLIVAHALEPRPRWTDPSVTRSEEASAVLADELAATLEASPDRFEELRRVYCDYDLCNATATTYLSGASAYPGLDEELRKVPSGAVTQTPVWHPAGFVLARREDPAKFPLPKFQPRLELPTGPDTPQEVDVARRN